MKTSQLRSFLIGINIRVVRFLVFLVIREMAHTKASAISFVMERIREESGSHPLSTINVVALIAGDFYEVGMTAVKIETRYCYTAKISMI